MVGLTSSRQLGLCPLTTSLYQMNEKKKMNECLSYIWKEGDFDFYVFWLFIIFSLISLVISSFYSFILLLVSQLTQALCWGMKAPFCPLGDPI